MILLPDHHGSLLGVGELHVQLFYTAVGASHNSNVSFKSQIFFMIVFNKLMVRVSVLVLIVVIFNK